MKSSILALVGGASTALAAVRGFNYASQGQTQQMFDSQFKTAASLAGASDFTSARLYTMIQEGTANTPISAIQSAIDTNSTLLLGLWASQAQAGFNNELAALKSAISQYPQLADLVVGISVGSEDLYRISTTGLSNDPNGVGQSPDVLVDYIGQVRTAIQGTSLSSKPVGHVDTWNVYVNGSNSKVIAACDWLGLDEYPYYQTTDSNSIDNAAFLFFQAYDRVAAVAGGKPIWVTEAGWPTSGPNSNLAVASIDNAETFWQGVACELECRNVNFWWYILADAGASPSFGVSQNGVPIYDLSCTKHTCGSTGGSSNNSSSNGTSTGSGSGNDSGSRNGTSSANGTANGTATGGSSSATATGGSGSASGTSGSGSGSGSGTATSSGAQASYTNAAFQTEASAMALVMGFAAAFFAL